MTNCQKRKEKHPNKRTTPHPHPSIHKQFPFPYLEERGSTSYLDVSLCYPWTQLSWSISKPVSTCWVVWDIKRRVRRGLCLLYITSSEQTRSTGRLWNLSGREIQRNVRSLGTEPPGSFMKKVRDEEWTGFGWEDRRRETTYAHSPKVYFYSVY